MKCPPCGVDLHMTERQGIEIDYCPPAEGLGRTAENSTRLSSGHRLPPRREAAGGREEGPDRSRWEDPSEYGRPPYERKKKRSFLGDLFDFD